MHHEPHHEPGKEGDFMTAKQYLKQAYRLNDLIKSNQQELADLRLLSDGVPGIDYSKERVQSSPSQDAPFVHIVCKIIELENEINAEINRMVSLKLEIRSVINAVQDHDERLLLKYRYLNFMQWDDICEHMQVSMRTAHRIHAAALANVQIPKS